MSGEALLEFQRGSARGTAVHLDPVTLVLIAAIVLLGLVMVTSASMSIAGEDSGQPFYYLERQLLLTLIGDLATLANTVVLLLLLVFLSTNVAVLVLRRDHVPQDHFRVPAVVPVLATASCLVLLWQQEARTWFWAGVLLAVGVALHLLAQAPWWRSEPASAPEPERETAA